ncbi:MAG: hypothetical protein QXO17_03095 [Nitrososphaerota archaeon]|nr:hypothetical protein [Candidatus Calditenuis fumarioli]
MRREGKLTVRRSGRVTSIRIDVEDWLGLLALLLAASFVALLLSGRTLEATLVGTFGGGLSLGEMVRRARRSGRG